MEMSGGLSHFGAAFLVPFTALCASSASITGTAQKGSRVASGSWQDWLFFPLPISDLWHIVAVHTDICPVF